MGEKNMQKINFYIDDSGVLHEHDRSGVFVYAGLCFTDDKKRQSASRRYHAVAKQIKNNAHIDGELKASKLKENPKYKGSLFRTISKENLLYLKVDNTKVYENILENTKSIHRYKDYVLKMMIKQKINDCIETGEINASDDIWINILIDEQGTSTDGIYSLQSSIYEELAIGISNFNYGKFYPPLFSGRVDVSVRYCDSSSNTLIRAADIVANRIWYSYVTDKPDFRQLYNCSHLIFP